MSKSLNTVMIPPDLGTRLRVLDRLSRTPQTLDEYGTLLQERIRKDLEEPGSRAYFQKIFKGTEIFGHVDYETRHKVQLSGKEQVHVACALDALIEGFFQPIRIDSTCFHCGEPVQVRMSRGIADRVKPSSCVVWLGASQAGEGSCETYLCPYINFFSSSEHVEEWQATNPNELGMRLTLQQGLELARKGYWEAVRQSPTETSQQEY
ncbi:MAG: alkylmercury lyase family protein [Candidatus Bathyarchaeota archaeon]|nr:MAG: alkylmercury lyase family protein [Candidatus Bathyarchaeota archaeon]